jgi:hypothetical protein
MARNGSGTYNLPAGNPVVTGTTISSTTTNNTFSDIATALTGSISADGQTTPTGNLPMGTFAHTGVGNATVRTMYATGGQVQDNTFQYLTSVAGTNVITATAPFGMTAYATGQRFTFIAAGANTGATTLNLNSIGAKSITKNGTTPLVASDIAINAVVQVVYDGTQFQLLNPASVSSFSAGSTGLTPSTATTGAVTLAGTLAVANGGTGTATPAIVAGTNVTVSGSFPNQTINAPNPPALSTASGSAPSYSARAWVNFNGTGTVAIRASGNVSSITDNGVGDYTINFTTAMADINYALAGSASNNTALANGGAITIPAVLTASSAGFIVIDNNSDTKVDSSYVAVNIFR